MADRPVVLVFPKVSGLDVYNSKLIRAPLGVLVLATYLKQAGIPVVIVDERKEHSVCARIDQILSACAPTCFAFSVMTGNQIHFALQASRHIKKRCDVPIVWGGVHPTLEPESTAADPNVDIVVKGEGEVPLSTLATVLRFGGSLEDVPGLCTWSSKGAFHSKPAQPVHLDSLPFVEYSLVDYTLYTEISGF